MREKHVLPIVHGRKLISGLPLSYDLRAETDPLHLAVGRAVSAWGVVESRLAELYGWAAGVSEDIAFKTFYTERIFDRQLDLIQNELKTKLECAELWQKLRKECVDFKRARNAVAHGIVLLTTYEGAGGETYVANASVVPHIQNSLIKTTNGDYDGLAVPATVVEACVEPFLELAELLLRLKERSSIDLSYLLQLRSDVFLKE